MTGEAAEAPAAGGPAPWARLLDAHRARWAAAALAGRLVVDLAAAEDPLAALADAPPDAAFVWLEGYVEADERERLRTALAEAARREAPVMVGFDVDGEGLGPREAEALAGELEQARVVTQELAAGSLIGADALDDATARRRSVHLLVCGNLELDGADADVGADAAPLMSGYVAWLEQANRELRKANARLGRDRLGHHDAAAAAVVDRRADLEQRVEQLEAALEQQRKETEASHRAFLEAQWDKESTLQAPRYRFVDSLRGLVFSVPGVSLLFKLRSRRVSKEWDRNDD